MRAGSLPDDIPLEARVLCIADSFDAMTSTRPYRTPWGPDEALEELARCAGSRGGRLMMSGSAGSASKTTEQAGSMIRWRNAMWTGSRIRGQPNSTGSSDRPAIGM